MQALTRPGLLYACLAALLFSASPVFTRWATASLSAAEITFGRLLVGGLAVCAIALWRREPLPRPRVGWLYLGLGLGLCLHFLAYASAIRYTTLAHTLTIVYSSMVFIALLSRFALGERLSRRQWAGVGLALIGLAALTGFETRLDRRMLLGDLWALGSAVTFALYSVAGRQQRTRTGLFAYAATLYLLAALCALPFAAFRFTPQGYTWPAVASVVAAGLVPMGLGHTLYNAALRSLNATAVNLIAAQEVVFAAAAGALLFGEHPTGLTLAGIGLTLAGVVLVAL